MDVDLSENVDSLKIVCKYCYKEFETKKEIEAHLSEHIGLVVCANCNKSFSNQNECDAHIKKEHSKLKSSPTQDNIMCRDCKKNFKEQDEFERHMKEEHKQSDKSRQFNCQDCSFQASTSLELRKHMKRTQHEASEYSEVCHNCNETFASYFLLMDHRKMLHPSKKLCRYFQKGECLFESDTCWYKHELQSKGFESKFTCRKCGILHQNHSDFKSHINSCHGQQNEKQGLTCDKCEDTFEEERALKSHMESHHDKNGVLHFKCDKCDYSCEEQTSLKRHMETRHDRNTNDVIDHDVSSLDFQKIQEKMPPDMNRLVEIVKNMVLQVKDMEMLSQKI